MSHIPSDWLMFLWWWGAENKPVIVCHLGSRWGYLGKKQNVLKKNIAFSPLAADVKCFSQGSYLTHFCVCLSVFGSHSWPSEGQLPLEQKTVLKVHSTRWKTTGCFLSSVSRFLPKWLRQLYDASLKWPQLIDCLCLLLDREALT